MKYSLISESVPKSVLHGELFDLNLLSLVGQLVRVKIEFGDEGQQAHIFLDVCSIDGDVLIGQVVSQWAKLPSVMRQTAKLVPVGAQIAFERKHILYFGGMSGI